MILEKIRINNARNMIQDRRTLMEMRKDEIKFVISENTKAQEAIGKVNKYYQSTQS